MGVFMETRKSRFEDHMNTIEASHSKSAAAKKNALSGNDLLAKLAQELNLNEPEKTINEAISEAAPSKEGEVIPAASTIAEANSDVEEATDAVAMPQVMMAGGVPADMEAGSAPNPESLIMPVISAADGNIQTANDLGRTPEAVAAAAEPTSKGVVSAEEMEAEKIGRLIAKSFQEALEKSAYDAEYIDALNLLKEAGLLEGYNIKGVEIEKTASAEGFLEKIANREKLTKDDIIGAANELIEFNKQAAIAEEEGREAANNLVDFLVKVSQESEEDKEGESDEEEMEESAEEKKKENEKEEAGETKESQLKIASLLSDPKVVEAIKTLKSNGLI